MFNLEDDIRAWKQLLIDGEIDEITYNKEVAKLIKKAKSKTDKNKSSNFTRIILKVIFISTMIFLLAMSYRELTYKTNIDSENIEYVKSLRNIPNPTQIKSSGKVTREIDNLNIEINFVYAYKIMGRVVNVKGYYDNSITSKLSQRDIGLTWGILAKDENNAKINVSSLGNRYLFWHSDDGSWINAMGGTDKIDEMISNNHLIPSNDKIKKLINSIKKDDYVKIEGYLVNVNSVGNSNKNFKWNTSTSRKDQEDGACEIIYVTDIKWLQEKN